MMKRIYLVMALFCTTAVIVAISCKKKKTTTTYDSTNLNKLFSDLKTAPQSFTVQAGRDTVIVGHDSTLIRFYPNSFKDAAGNIITSGTINIDLVEMYKSGDMVLNRTVTATADAQLLKSAGQVNIKAVMNGKEVFANKYGLGFKQPGSSADKMALFYGGNDNEDSVVTWTSSDTKLEENTTTVNPLDTGAGFPFRGGYYYLFDSCGQFDLVNCDRLYDPKVKNTTASIIMPDATFNPSNTQVYIILPATNSATMGDERQEYNSDRYTFKIGNHGNLVPIGMDYIIVVIANKDGTFYFDMKKGVITDGLSVKMDMAVETRGDIKARMAAIK